MVFYGFIAVIALALLALFIRSPQFRQFRRGHGTDRPPSSSSNDYVNNQDVASYDPTRRPPHEQG